MNRTNYKGHIIDTDNLGRVYIYNTASPYSEDSDRAYLTASDYIGSTPYKELTDLQAAKNRINRNIEHSC